MTLNVLNSQRSASTESAHSASSVESQPIIQEERLTEVKELCQKEGVGVVPEHLVKLQTLAQEKIVLSVFARLM
ncbi:hypothetical protein QRZ34_28510 [Klebsiella michiganensis]|uniref:hypothetical protein n=1 Tax=Klebsiella michiganensis TaxID=1134687 RepID=UPI00257040B8|nr:hypothetical protein [Klebsiella michiganensis]MDL4454937.1 hypothetical protein [Klebsiella michiganensis]